jgi:hypothetical protein
MYIPSILTAEERNMQGTVDWMDYNGHSRERFSRWREITRIAGSGAQNYRVSSPRVINFDGSSAQHTTTTGSKVIE